MPILARSDLADLSLFTTLVRRRSFKAAAAELGLTTSAASHALRRLEDRLGVRLVNRTSRSVAPTPAGLALAVELEAGFGSIEAAVGRLGEAAASRFGSLRLNVPRDASFLLIGPALPAFAARYADLHFTVVVEDRPIDVVAEGYDAGIRYGDTVPEDMIAFALTPPLRWVVVGAPAYLDRRGEPQTPADLADHSCLRLLLGDNSTFRWELGEGENLVRIDVPGPYTINDTQTTIDAAVRGLGLAYVLERRVQRELESGALRVVMPDWASTGPGLSMYYANRRYNHPALRVLIDLIRATNGL